MIVVDASVVVDLLLRTDTVAAIESRLARRTSLHAPHMLDIEVTHVLRRHVRSGVIDSGRGDEALGDLILMPIRRYPHTALLPRIWQLRDNMSAYDAAYVALAEALDAPLITRDRRLASTTSHDARIEVV